jgi:hypothetical protein
MGTIAVSIHNCVHVSTHPRGLLIVVVLAEPMPVPVAVLVSMIVAAIVATAHIRWV